jgi:probable rRNA maturation factor
VNEAEGRALNRTFRGRDYATNVLTFVYQAAPVVVADLVLSAPIVAEEARRQAIGLVEHYAHLLVHGALHAQGHDHKRAGDARRMQAIESRLMRALGFADPYAS